MPNRTIAPPIKDAVDFQISLQPCKRISLSNGVPVYYLNDGAEEVAVIDFIFEAGNSFERKNGVGATTNYLLKNGTDKKSAFDITEYFEYYGAYLSTRCNNETASITLHCLSKHLNQLLPLIRELITEAVFPESELDIFKQNTIQQLSVNLLKCDFVANRLIDQYLYGARHPYGRVSSKANIEALTRENLLAFFDRYYLHGKCSVFVAGKLPTDFEKVLDTNFGDLYLNEKKSTPVYKRQMEENKIHFINNDKNGVQGAIRIGRPFPNRKHPDFKKAMVLNTLFVGYFGSRLMGNIREEKGYTYGIHSYLENHLEDNAWIISTEAGKEVCKETISEVYKEMKLLRDEPVNEEELLLVKNYMMGLNLGYIDGPFNIIARWKSLIINGLEEKDYYDSLRVIREITAEELQETANNYLVPEQFYELLVI